MHLVGFELISHDLTLHLSLTREEPIELELIGNLILGPKLWSNI